MKSRLPLLDRLLLAADLYHLGAARTTTPTHLDGRPLAPGLHVAVGLDPACTMAALRIRLSTRGSTLLVIEDGTLSGAIEALDDTTTFALRVELDDLPDAVALAGRRGAFDLLVVGLETTREEDDARAALAARIVSLCQRLPPRPWLFLGIGQTGWKDPLMSVLRRSACTVAASAP